MVGNLKKEKANDSLTENRAWPVFGRFLTVEEFLQRISFFKLQYVASKPSETFKKTHLYMRYDGVVVLIS